MFILVLPSYFHMKNFEPTFRQYYQHYQSSKITMSKNNTYQFLVIIIMISSEYYWKPCRLKPKLLHLICPWYTYNYSPHPTHTHRYTPIHMHNKYNITHKQIQQTPPHSCSRAPTLVHHHRKRRTHYCSLPTNAFQKVLILGKKQAILGH